MRVVLLAFGSRGDVQPMVALGLGLQQAGHEVRVVSSGDSGPFVRGQGLEFAGTVLNTRRSLQSGAGRKWVASGGSLVRSFWYAQRKLRPLLRQNLEECWRACAGAEVIVYNEWGAAGWPIAEKLGIPCFATRLAPWDRILPRNKLVRTLGERMVWSVVGGPTNRWRTQTLQLPPVSFRGSTAHKRVPQLRNYSPVIVPEHGGPEWPDWYRVTGFWFLDRPMDWQPPVALLHFLDGGAPPVFVGFGSMPVQDPAGMTALVVAALRRTGQRGVLSAGWGGLGQADLPNDVLLVDDVPHDWLFPRMAAVVHHGGPGTMAQGLRAGIPAVIVPFFGDQPFWGRRLAELGAGPSPIPVRRLTADGLAAAIAGATGDTTMRSRVATFGEQIRAEDGVGNAVAAIHEYMRRPVNAAR